MKRCNKCNTYLDENSKCCPNCFSYDISSYEKQHRIHCLNCGAEQILGDKYCRACLSNDLEEYDYYIKRNLLTNKYEATSTNFKRINFKTYKKKGISPFLTIIILIIVIGLSYLYINKDKFSLVKNEKILNVVNNNYAIPTSIDKDVSNYTHRNNSHYDDLSTDEKLIYDYLHYRSIELLENNINNTIIEINNTSFNYDNFYNIDISKILNAFDNDYPYLAWWLKGASLNMHGSNNNNIIDLTLTINLANYFKSTSNKNKIDEEILNKARNSYLKAKEIASIDYENANDLLDSFKDYILSNVTYDNDVASSINSDNYINEYNYQMASNFIYVFDEDNATNVICGGYSEAFLLLCDLANIKDCYYVTGLMNNTGHAWNTITNNGNRFIVDITNTSLGSIGQYGELYLKTIPDTKEYTIETYYSGTVDYIEN